MTTSVAREEAEESPFLNHRGNTMANEIESGHEGCCGRPSCCSEPARHSESEARPAPQNEPSAESNGSHGLEDDLAELDHRIHGALDYSDRLVAPQLEPSHRDALHLRARIAAVATQIGELRDLASRVGARPA